MCVIGEKVMSMTVGGVNSGVNNNPQKKSNIGTKIGAGIGLAVGAVRLYQTRNLINELGDQLILAGQSKAAANAAKGLGAFGAVALFVGVGALVGKGVQKLVNHFKKDKIEPKGVIPGENPNPQPKVEGNPFEKYRADASKLGRTVKTKDKEEYVIFDGHPKKVFKKNPETGELEFKIEVYDGSWGKEASDEAIVELIKTFDKELPKK